MSYVTAGYAPLLVRLVEALGTPGGWNALSEVIKLLPGPFVEFDQSKIQGNGHSFDRFHDQLHPTPSLLTLPFPALTS
jgi:hypothetical protein